MRLRLSRSQLAADSANGAARAGDADTPQCARRSASISLRRQRAVARERRSDRRGTARDRAARPAPPPDRSSAWASSCASRSGVRRLRAGARRSRKRPPPMVRCAEVSRSTKRSPAAAAIGCSSTSCTRASLAGRDRLVAKQHDARADFGRGVVQPHRHPLRDRLRLGLEQTRSGRIDAVGRRVQLGIEHHVAAADGILG